jgi:hypothetical protein
VKQAKIAINKQTKQKNWRQNENPRQTDERVSRKKIAQNVAQHMLSKNNSYIFWYMKKQPEFGANCTCMKRLPVGLDKHAMTPT